MKVSLRDVLNIDDVHSIFKLFFSIELVWNDIEVQFCYLKDIQQKNIVGKGIWKPKLEFIHMASSFDEFNAVTLVEKLTKPKMIWDLDTINTCEEYKGL